MGPKDAKAKAVGKAATKVSGKASAPVPKPPPKLSEPTVPAVPGPSEAVTLTAKQAEALLSSLCAEELRILAETQDKEEQLAARQVLEYVCDKDVSWANAQRSLSTGNQLVNEILEMQAGEFITKPSLQRFEELGHPDVSTLWGKSRTAYILAIFVQACLRDARDRLGLTAATPPPPPMADEPPAWPLVIGFKVGTIAMCVCTLTAVGTFSLATLHLASFISSIAESSCVSFQNVSESGPSTVLL